MQRSKHGEQQQQGRCILSLPRGCILRRRPRRAGQPAARSWACALPTWRWMCAWEAGSTRRASAPWPPAPGSAPSSTPSPTALLPPPPQAEGHCYSRSLPTPAALVPQRRLLPFRWGWWCCRMCLRTTADARSSTCLAGERERARARARLSRWLAGDAAPRLLSRVSPLSSLGCRTPCMCGKGVAEQGRRALAA